MRTRRSVLFSIISPDLELKIKFLFYFVSSISPKPTCTSYIPIRCRKSQLAYWIVVIRNYAAFCTRVAFFFFSLLPVNYKVSFFLWILPLHILGFCVNKYKTNKPRKLYSFYIVPSCKFWRQKKEKKKKTGWKRKFLMCLNELEHNRLIYLFSKSQNHLLYTAPCYWEMLMFLPIYHKFFLWH